MSIVGPELRFDPAFVRPIIGGGTGILIDDQIDWKVTNNHLLVENDSRVRPAILAGALFNVKSFTQKLRISWPNIAPTDSGLVKFAKHLPKVITIPANIALLPLRATDDILVSLEFAEGTSRTLDGFVFGFSKRLSKNLSFVIGYSLRKGRELSPGFRRFAANAIASDTTNHYSSFNGFTKHTKGKKANLLDGFPLTIPSGTDSNGEESLFPGEPIISIFNSAIHIGLIVPLDLIAIFAQDN